MNLAQNFQRVNMVGMVWKKASRSKMSMSTVGGFLFFFSILSIQASNI